MLGLTRQERQVILFLLGMAILGMGVDFLVKKFSSAKVMECLKRDIGKVNLNQADKASLMDIAGIGEKISTRVLEYRDRNGGFRDIEELRKIKGVNDYRFQKLKEVFFVE